LLYNYKYLKLKNFRMNILNQMQI